MQVEGVGLNALAPTKNVEGGPTPSTRSDSSRFAEVLKQQKTQEVVSARRTQLSTAEAKTALRAAWSQHFGEAPREETVAVLTAQWSHETGNGHSMFNYNFGGIKGVGPSGLSVHQRTREGYGDHERTIRDHFRAYRNATEGASDYLSLLVRRYPKAVEAAHEGKPAQFVRELKKGGYFTGNESAYIKSVERRTEQLLGHTPTAISGDPRSKRLVQQQDSTAAAPFSAVRTPAQSLGQELAPALRTSPAQSGHSLSPLDDSAASTLASAAPGAPASPRRLEDLPRTFDLQNFDDALSRAALRIALYPNAQDRERT